MFSSLDDARGSVRRESPELVILTGVPAVEDPLGEFIEPTVGLLRGAKTRH